MAEICAIGGYNEVGRNSTAIKIGDEVIIFDMGVHLDRYIGLTEDESDVTTVTAKALTEAGAVPDLKHIKDWTKNVKAIIPTHAHLDHIGAIPFLWEKFRNVPVICTPFTKAVLKMMFKDDEKKLPNKIIDVDVNGSYRISKNITIQFINITHSIPQATIVALHTPEGVFIYGNDFKFDNYPTLGPKPNYKALKQLGKKGVKCLILDSLYSSHDGKTPSESVARDMLKDVLLGIKHEKKAIVITTFSSHLARLKSIIEFSKKLNRRVIMLGRSLNKYIRAGEETGIIKFSKEVEMVKYSSKIKRKLQTLRDAENCILVVTGHQGEPKSTLSKMASDDYPFQFIPGDTVIFSSKIIPTEMNKNNREKLEQNLRAKQVKIFKDIHVSGHGSKEEHRELLKMLRPENVIPSHGPRELVSPLGDVCRELGYDKKNIHLLENGTRVTIQ